MTLTSHLIAMGIEQCLQHLATSQKWYMDGNFTVAPKSFQQVRCCSLYLSPLIMPQLFAKISWNSAILVTAVVY